MPRSDPKEDRPMAITTLSREFGNKPLSFESGRMARLAHGAVTLTYGETQVLATCVSSAPREGIDFFPLTIDVEERMYAAGKIPGSFFRREGRPSETAVLTCRLIDRPMRPTFKDGFRDEVQVVITVLGVDGSNPYDVPAMNAASIATSLAGLPFDGPVGSVRMGLIEGEWVINPTFQEIEEATFDVVVAGRRNDTGEIDVLMIEGEAPDNTWRLLADGATAPTEEVVAEGLEAAKRAIGTQIDLQAEFIAQVGVTERPWEPKPLYGDDVFQLMSDFAKSRLEEAIVPDKTEREAKLDALKAEAKEHAAATLGDAAATRSGELGPAWKALQKKVMRKRVLDEGIRLDGRTPTDIRPLSAEVGVLKRAHGSALFSRGDTQVLNITTLGMLRMKQMIDTLDLEDSKRYMHH
jgi:polyribonucleotide nucleotidyltransferase